MDKSFLESFLSRSASNGHQYYNSGDRDGNDDIAGRDNMMVAIGRAVTIHYDPQEVDMVNPVKY